LDDEEDIKGTLINASSIYIINRLRKRCYLIDINSYRNSQNN
jgi:hypothetical protein